MAHLTKERLESGFNLGDREIKPLEGNIIGPAGVRHVHPKVMEVLLCLAQQPDQVVRRAEIIDRVWGHCHGSDKALTRCVSELRFALGDARGPDTLIQTVPKRGYRLTTPVGIANPPSDAAGHDSDRFDKYTIAVLPFANVSEDPSQDYFSDGITEDIITELSRVPAFFVIARNSTFQFRNSAATYQEISQSLGARYLVHGSVRKVNDRVRVTAKLIDGDRSVQLWAERYDRQLADIFTVQDDLTGQIVSVLMATLTRHSSTSDPRHLPANLDAYEHMLRGRELAWLHTRESVAEARRLLVRAMWLDPSYGTTYSWLAFTHVIDYVTQWREQPGRSLRLAQELATKAVALDDSAAQAHFVLGECRLWGERRHDDAIAHARRAIELEPSYSHAHLLRGHVLHYAGRSEEALEPFAIAMRLDPCYPDLYLHFLAQCYYSLGRYEAVIETLQKRLERNATSDISCALLAASYGRLGMKNQAEAYWASTKSFNPSYSIEQKRRVLPYKHAADFDDFVAGLRAAQLVA